MEKELWSTEDFRKKLRDIVNIDSGSDNKEGVGRVGKYLIKECERIGLNVESYDGDTRFFASHNTDEEYDFLFVGHMDTVFSEGTVKERPYTEEGTMAYGPGVADMKAGDIMIVFLAEKLVKNHPEISFCVAFNGDEEVGSDESKKWLDEIAVKAKYVLVFEPGREGNAFVKSRKGSGNILAKFRGISSHAGIAPEKGANAITEMGKWVVELSSLQNLEKGTSISAGYVNGGGPINVIPDYAEVGFDFRFKDPLEAEKIVDKANELAMNVSVSGVSVDYEIPEIWPAMNPNEKTLELIDRINKKAVELEMNIGWVETGGASDANHISSIGSAVICGCGPCGGNLHSDQEFLMLDSIENRLNLLYSTIVDIS
ncbi:MAG: M20 family metallopeptidase [Frisingicoccus sp.]|uniref:M20 family metallopeptidase n=1 Tax=Frisingicoccus sp. TaxID=1918627 RepID=UPI0026096699|nr:M20 family metallopeptidase [Frisingicoccus sp.]MDD6231322.1 M20 family metallopeptidase [Frisingicoccus sp.]